MTNRYESPLSSRYASEYMLGLFSSDTRYQTWRRLWVALAKAEMNLGLPITQEQVDELSAHITDIDYDCVSQREKEVRHDVMAHIYAYGQAAPSAAGIIHLGATSCYVTDNADLIIYRDALTYLRSELLGVLANLSDFAEKYKALPTLGYTHYQPAQLVTVGKRAALWMQDFLSDLKEIDFAIENIKFLGCRGTTGTEGSNPIADLTVTEIYEFLRYLKAPDCVIDKAPSAALFDGQIDENEMGVTYAELDAYLFGKNIPEDKKQIINCMHKASQHKRTEIKKFQPTLLE